MTALKAMMNAVYAVVITQVVLIVPAYQMAALKKMNAAYVMVQVPLMNAGMVL